MGNSFNTRKFLSRKYSGIYILTGSPNYNPDYTLVKNAIESTGITLTSTQNNAGNTLVNDLQSNGTWAKAKLLNGILGGTSGGHKWNWKNPVDTNAAYRLTFTTGFTHANTGFTPNGTSAYFNTFLAAGSVLTLNSTTIGYYSRTAAASNGSDLGVINGAAGGNPTTELQIRNTLGNTAAWVNKTNAGRLQVANSDGRGFFMATSNGTTTQTIYKNGVSQGSNNVTSAAVNTYGMVGCAENNTGTIGAYSNKECAFLFIGDGMNSTEAGNLYNSIQSYQTTLGRQV